MPRTYARTAKDIERGLLPRRTRTNEPHWYIEIIESGCLLCGRRPWSSERQRIRMPGNPPKDPRKRYANFEHDWACNDHFM